MESLSTGKTAATLAGKWGEEGGKEKYQLVYIKPCIY